jgi:ubiquinone/menaquinone biosynthesis C-methylase UbiE
MRSDTLDGAFSTMTFHEFAEEGALAELERVLVEGSRFAVADWSAEGTGEVGPPQSERYDLAAAEELAEAAGFSVRRGQERRETFVMSLEA